MFHYDDQYGYYTKYHLDLLMIDELPISLFGCMLMVIVVVMMDDSMNEKEVEGNMNVVEEEDELVMMVLLLRWNMDKRG